jgi:hypothetical protein
MSAQPAAAAAAVKSKPTAADIGVGVGAAARAVGPADSKWREVKERIEESKGVVTFWEPHCWVYDGEKHRRCADLVGVKGHKICVTTGKFKVGNQYLAFDRHVNRAYHASGNGVLLKVLELDPKNKRVLLQYTDESNEWFRLDERQCHCDYCEVVVTTQATLRMCLACKHLVDDAKDKLCRHCILAALRRNAHAKKSDRKG